MTGPRRTAVKHRHLSFPLLFIGLLLAVSCGGSSEEDNSTAEARITASGGGELRLADGSMTLTVPPGAVSEDVNISVTRSDHDVAFDLKPDGLRFAVPASVELTLQSDQIEIDQESGELSVLGLVVSDSDGTEPLGNVENRFDTDSQTLTVTGELEHFSKLITRESGLRVSMDQVVPDELPVGETFRADARIREEENAWSFSVDWTWLVSERIEIDQIFTSGVVSPAPAVSKLELGEFTERSTRRWSGRGVEVDEATFQMVGRMKCSSVGRANYTLSATAKSSEDVPESGIKGTVRISHTATLSCISTAAAEATATSMVGDDALATAAAGLVATATPTSVVRPTQTPFPTPLAADDRLRLVVAATTFDTAPGTGEPFQGFLMPATGGGFTYFTAFVSGNVAGVYQFEEDVLVGGVVEPISVPGGRGLIGTLVTTAFEPPSVNGAGTVVYAARSKSNDLFHSYIVSIDKDGRFASIAEEWDTTPGVEDQPLSNPAFPQVTNGGAVLFRGVAGSRGLWLRDPNGSYRLVLMEGQALPGLDEGWRTSGGDRVEVSWFSDEGLTLLYLPGYFENNPNSSNQAEAGLWLERPTGFEPIAQTNKKTPDGRTYDTILRPSMNAAGDVTYLSVVSSPTTVSEVIWKTDPNGALEKVIETGDRLTGTNIELSNFNIPLMGPDGNVTFLANGFDEQQNLISMVVTEDGDGFRVIARSDALPGESGPVSLVPSGIINLASNVRGQVAFSFAFGQSIWMQSPRGTLQRVIGIGDSFELQTNTGPKQVSVTFAEFLDGAVTNAGRSTGFSDAGDLAMRVQFSDGSEAIIVATFADEPVVN